MERNKSSWSVSVIDVVKERRYSVFSLGFTRQNVVNEGFISQNVENRGFTSIFYRMKSVEGSCKS